VHEPQTHQVVHYVEKPDSFISNTVNGGVYRKRVADPCRDCVLIVVFDKSLFDEIKTAMDDKSTRAAEDPLIKQDEMLRLEQDVIAPLAASRKMYVYQTKDFWRQVKTAA
jgi:mannose-1-phosphate guanylyltransferase